MSKKVSIDFVEFGSKLFNGTGIECINTDRLMETMDQIQVLLANKFMVVEIILAYVGDSLANLFDQLFQ